MQQVVQRVPETAVAAGGTSIGTVGLLWQFVTGSPEFTLISLLNFLMVLGGVVLLGFKILDRVKSRKEKK